MNRARLGLAVAALALASPALARDRLGVWNDWGAFRDAGVPRCYAIAMASAQPGQSRTTQPYITVANWPRRGVHGEVHARLSRPAARAAPVAITIGRARFALIAAGIDAWSADRQSDAAIIAALRNGSDMVITVRGDDGRTVRDSYRLSGAASALDAANLGCASR